jgi:hypothetical protein
VNPLIRDPRSPEAHERGPRPPAELKERSLADRNRCGARAPFLYSNLAGVRCHGRLPRTAIPRLDDPTGGVRARCKKKPGNDLLSHSAARAVPSARAGLTSVFGMGTGVSPPLWSPGFLFVRHYRGTAPFRGRSPSKQRFFVLINFMVKPHGLLVLVSSIHHWTYTPSLSNRSSTCDL